MSFKDGTMAMPRLSNDEKEQLKKLQDDLGRIVPTVTMAPPRIEENYVETNEVSPMERDIRELIGILRDSFAGTSDLSMRILILCAKIETRLERDGK